MYLSKVTLLDSADARSARQKLAANGCYASHQLLWQMFREQSSRDFLFTQLDGQLDQFLVLSHSKPDTNQAILRVESKLFSPKLFQGQRLAFQITVNPTVCKNKHRHDVVMNTQQTVLKEQLEKLGRAPNSDKKSSLKSQLLDFATDNLVQIWRDDLQLTDPVGRTELLSLWLSYQTDQALRRWWQKRLEKIGAATDQDSFDICAYQQHQVSKGSQQIRFSTVQFSGQLEVQNPELLLSSIGQGIGRSKAFGCGLLLIKPIS